MPLIESFGLSAVIIFIPFTRAENSVGFYDFTEGIFGSVIISEDSRIFPFLEEFFHFFSLILINICTVNAVTRVIWVLDPCPAVIVFIVRKGDLTIMTLPVCHACLSDFDETDG